MKIRLAPLLSSLLLLIALAAQAQTDLMIARTYVAPGDSGERIIGSESTLSFLVSDAGPADAKNVVISLGYPASLHVRAIDADAKVCEINATEAQCVLGDLFAGAWQTPDGRTCCKNVAVRVVMPKEPQTMTLKISVSSDALDTNPSNNAVAVDLTAVVRADLSVDVDPYISRTDPGATVEIHANVNNWYDTWPTDLVLDLEAGNGTIEKIVPPPGWTCSIQPSAAHCTGKELIYGCRCFGDFTTTVRTPQDRAGGLTTFRVSASSSFPDPYTLNNGGEAIVQTYRWIAVTNTADGGEGSLRAAIEEANRGCSSNPCRIAFEIAEPVPASGFFTMAPSTPLPAITASRVFVDGATQTLFSGDTNSAGPEIAIDGRFVTEGDGLDIRSRCEGAVRQLSIGNFPGYGIFAPIGSELCPDSTLRWWGQGYLVPDQRTITGSYIGTDPTGTQAWPNLRGIRADGGSLSIVDNLISGNRRSGIWMWGGTLGVYRNRIGTAADGVTPLPNGASGVFLGPDTRVAGVSQNVIAFQPDMGVAIMPGAMRVFVSSNSMKGIGGLGIDRGLDGRDAPSDLPDLYPNAPTLLSATFDPASGHTAVTVTLRTTLAFGEIATLQFFGNREPDGQGETYLGSALVYSFMQPPRTEGQPFTIDLPRDARGLWITATSTRSDDPEVPAPPYAQVGTSEFSNAVFVDR